MSSIFASECSKAGRTAPHILFSRAAMGAVDASVSHRLFNELLSFIQTHESTRLATGSKAYRRAFCPQYLPLCEKINCNQREQKVGNKHSRASIIFRDSLAKKQRHDGCS